MVYRSVAFIGAGNVAVHLATAMEQVGHSIKYIYNRNLTNAEALVDLLYEAQVKDNLDFRGEGIDLIIIAIADDAIVPLAEQIQVDLDTLIVHTAGSVEMNKLSYVSGNIGVLYPFQTFSKSRKVDFRSIPILIEGGTRLAENQLFDLGRSLSDDVQKATSGQRKAVHIAAVFSCNFVNHLISISEELLHKEKYDLSLIEPLVRETMDKVFNLGARNSQTGPALREDYRILDSHMEYLENNPSRASLYKQISQHIIDKKNND